MPMLTTLFLLIAMTVLVCIVPGPDMLYTITIVIVLESQIVSSAAEHYVLLAERALKRRMISSCQCSQHSSCL